MDVMMEPGGTRDSTISHRRDGGPCPAVADRRGANTDAAATANAKTRATTGANADAGATGDGSAARGSTGRSSATDGSSDDTAGDAARGATSAAEAEGQLPAELCRVDPARLHGDPIGGHRPQDRARRCDGRGLAEDRDGLLESHVGEREG